jgi:hypothetical protein
MIPDVLAGMEALVREIDYGFVRLGWQIGRSLLWKALQIRDALSPVRWQSRRAQEQKNADGYAEVFFQAAWQKKPDKLCQLMTPQSSGVIQPLVITIKVYCSALIFSIVLIITKICRESAHINRQLRSIKINLAVLFYE